MAKEKFERTKPHVNVGTIGHVDHGKTTLTAAITKTSGAKGSGGVHCVRRDRQGSRGAGAGDHDRDGSCGVRVGESSLRSCRLSGSRGLCEEHDHGCGADGRSDPGGFGCRRSDAADPRAHPSGPSGGVPSIVVYLNKVDMVDDDELLDLVEMEIQELLSQYDFPGDDTPIIRGSALKAWSRRTADSGSASRSSS